MNVITIYDYLLLPLYVALFYIILLRVSRQYKGTPLRRYFLIALTLRIVGGTSYSLFMYFYYGYGDMFGYFNGGEILADLIKKDLANVSNLVLNGKELYRISIAAGYGDKVPITMEGDPNAFVMKLSALFSFLTFGKFLITSLAFSILSFLGIWKIYTFLNLINASKYCKVLAWAVLYLPSIWFFGCGIQKEPICLLAMGLVLHAFYSFFVLKRHNLMHLVLLVICLQVLMIVKSYIAIILVIGLVLVVLYLLTFRTRSKFLKYTIIFTLVLGTIITAYGLDAPAMIQQYVEFSVKQITQHKHNYEVLADLDETTRAGFTLSDIEPTFSSLILNSGEAIVASLYRPFPWEARKAIIFLSSMEAFLTLLATLYVLVKSKFFGFFAAIFSSPYLLFCFTTAIMFALLIGFTTFNFGAIIRYKIILLPFYFYFLIAVNDKYRGEKHPEV